MLQTYDSSARLFFAQQSFRPSSDFGLLPCWTKLQFGSTMAWQENNSNSDVILEWNQIQDLLPCNNSPNSHGTTILSKYININLWFFLAQQNRNIWITAVPESCSMAELVQLDCLQSLIHNLKFDSDTVLLPCLPLVLLSRSTTSELGLSIFYMSLFKEVWKKI